MRSWPAPLARYSRTSPAAAAPATLSVPTCWPEWQDNYPQLASVRPRRASQNPVRPLRTRNPAWLGRRRSRPRSWPCRNAGRPCCGTPTWSWTRPRRSPRWSACPPPKCPPSPTRPATAWTASTASSSPPPARPSPLAWPPSRPGQPADAAGKPLRLPLLPPAPTRPPRPGPRHGPARPTRPARRHRLVPGHGPVRPPMPRRWPPRCARRWAGMSPRSSSVKQRLPTWPPGPARPALARPVLARSAFARPVLAQLVLARPVLARPVLVRPPPPGAGSWPGCAAVPRGWR